MRCKAPTGLVTGRFRIYSFDMVDKNRGGSRLPLAELDIEGSLRDPERKQDFVTPMFDLVAPRYDEFTRHFSFGMDKRWKRRLIDLAAGVAPREGAVADVACGTGDLAFALALVRPDLRITGVDASEKMIALARQRGARMSVAPNVTLVLGNLSALPLPDRSVDLVTGGYAVRNAPDWRAALAELARVLKPGGRLVTLDFYRPDNLVWRSLYLWYLSVAGRAFGWLWHREPLAYGYIARSIDHFTGWKEMARALEASGFRMELVEPRLGGGIAMHVAVRGERGV